MNDNRIQLEVEWVIRGTTYPSIYTHDLDCEKSQVHCRHGAISGSTRVEPLTLQCGDGELTEESKTKIRAAMGNWSSPMTTVVYGDRQWELRRGTPESIGAALYKAEQLFSLLNKLGIRLSTPEDVSIYLEIDGFEFSYKDGDLDYRYKTVIDESTLRGL